MWAFFVVFIVWMIVVLYILKCLISRVFPDDYSVWKNNYPRPLKKLTFLNGHIGLFKCNGVLRLDIYPDKLVVGALGKALCLDYSSYLFEEKTLLFFHALKVEGIRIHKTGGLGSLIGLFSSDDTTHLVVQLSKKDIEMIFDLIRQFRRNQHG